MTEDSWRSPTPTERALVERWAREWNTATGDDVAIHSRLQVRRSCSCGCPTFSARPLAVNPDLAKERPLRVEGTALRSDGTVAAGLIVFALDDNALDFEVYSLDEKPVALEDVTFVYIDDPA